MEVVQPGRKPEFCGLYELSVGNPNPVEFSIQILFPEIEELRKVWESGRLIEILPNEALQNVLVVGHPVEDFGSRDTVVVQLYDKTPIHENPRSLPYISKNHLKKPVKAEFQLQRRLLLY
jgi:hypothetical protein